MNQTDLIRRFILSRVQAFPADIAKRTAEHFGITRQAVNLVVKQLEAEGRLRGEGATRGRRYSLVGTAKADTPDEKLAAAAAEFAEHHELGPAAAEAIMDVARAMVRVKG